MDLNNFVKKQEAALKRYRRTYKFLDFITILLLTYTLMMLISVDQILPLIRSFEVRLESSYNIAGLSMSFSMVVLLIVSALISMLLTFLLHRKDDRASAIVLIEDKYPGLRERLRTACDNRTIDNIVVNDLVQKVLGSIAQTGAIVLLNRRLLTLALTGLVVSSTMFTVVTVYDLKIFDLTTDDWKDLIDKLPFAPDDQMNGGVPENDDTSDKTNSTDDITGPPIVVIMDGKEVDLSMPPGTGVGFNPGNNSEQENEFGASSAYNKTAGSLSSEAYNERLPKGYENEIKTYFEKMAQK